MRLRGVHTVQTELFALAVVHDGDGVAVGDADDFDLPCLSGIGQGKCGEGDEKNKERALSYQ